MSLIEVADLSRTFTVRRRAEGSRRKQRTEVVAVHDLSFAIDAGEMVLSAEPEPEDASADRLPFETLTTFFLAGERLQKNTLDPDGLDDLLAAVEVADVEQPPYGVDPRLWTRTCELANELADALTEGDEPDHEEAGTVAGELRDLLRPFV